MVAVLFEDVVKPPARFIPTPFELVTLPANNKVPESTVRFAYPFTCRPLPPPEIPLILTKLPLATAILAMPIAVVAILEEPLE